VFIETEMTEMTTMIERVAKAICAVNIKPEHLSYVDVLWGAHVNEARAAIEAMRYIDEQMAEAGFAHEHVLDNGYQQVYEAMIDAALKEE
jgi:hypothetical protein